MKYLVIKLGGSVMEQLPSSFYKNIVELLKLKQWVPIIVHGGGPMINALLKTLKIETQFVNGIRITDEKTLDIVEMVLSGSANKQIVRHIIKADGKAVGLSGVDGLLLKSQPVDGRLELGFVGEIVDVNKSLILNVIQQGYIPVISPIGIDEMGQRYNINGDIAASAVASAIGANLCFISDIPGIYINDNDQKRTLNTITKAEVDSMIESGEINGGMIPKVKAALNSLAHHVPEVSIINGLDTDSLIHYCKGEKIGTKIILNKEFPHAQ
jgi:acetylglutamate kinase